MQFWNASAASLFSKFVNVRAPLLRRRPFHQMPVRDIERDMKALAALCQSAPSDACMHALRKALSDKVNLVAAKAASLIAKAGLTGLIPDLCFAFDRLLVNPIKSDPKCWAKESIAKALKDLGHCESAIFLKGAVHVQLEPVWNGAEDTAATLRANCALALLACTDLTREDKLWHVMRLLTEASASLRKDGAVALESLAGREAALLLRIKARTGDEDATVTGQVFESLLRIEGEPAVPFVSEFLRNTRPETREEAALALGTSRLGPAVAALTSAVADKHPLLDSEVLYRALSISRHPDAFDFLYRIMQTGRPREAIGALDALKIYAGSVEIRTAVSNAIAHRAEPDIRREFDRLFPGS